MCTSRPIVAPSSRRKWLISGDPLSTGSGARDSITSMAHRVVRGLPQEAQAWAIKLGPNEGMGCAVGAAQSEADDEVCDRSYRGEMVGRWSECG